MVRPPSPRNSNSLPTENDDSTGGNGAPGQADRVCNGEAVITGAAAGPTNNPHWKGSGPMSSWQAKQVAVLASERFEQQLTPREQLVILRSTAKELADEPLPKPNNPATEARLMSCLEKEDPDAKVALKVEIPMRQEFVRWLITDPAVQPLISPQGFLFDADSFPQGLDLSHCQVTCPLAFADCTFVGPLTLSHASVSRLFVQGGSVPSIDLSFAKVTGDVQFISIDDLGALALGFCAIAGNLTLLRISFRASSHLDVADAEQAISMAAATVTGRFTLGHVKAEREIFVAGSTLGAVEIGHCDLSASPYSLRVIGCQITGDLGIQPLTEKALKRLGLEPNQDKFPNRLRGRMTLSLTSIGGNLSIRSLRVHAEGEIDARKEGFTEELKKHRDNRAIDLSATEVSGFTQLANLSLQGCLYGDRAVFSDGFLVDAIDIQKRTSQDFAALALTNCHFQEVVITGVDSHNATLDFSGSIFGSDLTLTAISTPWINLSKVRANSVRFASMVSSSPDAAGWGLSLRDATVDEIVEEDEVSRVSEGLLLARGLRVKRVRSFGSKHDAAVPPSVEWLNRQPQVERLSPVSWFSIAGVLEEEGDLKAAKRVRFEWRRHQARSAHLLRRPFAMQLAYLKRNPFYILWLFLPMLLITTSLFWGFRAHFSAKDHSGDSPRFRSFVYALETVLPVVKLDQDKNWAIDPSKDRQYEPRDTRISLPALSTVLEAWRAFAIFIGYVYSATFAYALGTTYKEE